MTLWEELNLSTRFYRKNFLIMNCFFFRMQRNKKRIKKSLNSCKNLMKSLIKYLVRRKAKIKNKCTLILKYFLLFNKEGIQKRWLWYLTNPRAKNYLNFAMKKDKYLVQNYQWKIISVRKRLILRKFKFLKNFETLL